MKKLRDGEISLSKELMDAILKSIDMLRVLIGHLKAKDGVEEDVSSLVQDLESALQNASSPHTSDDREDTMDTSDSQEGISEAPEPDTLPDEENRVEEAVQAADAHQAVPELSPESESEESKKEKEVRV